jgi:hypothetical protein
MNWDQNKEGGVYSSTSTEFYSLDQWRICGAGATGVFSVQRVASSAPGFPFSLNMVVTTQQAVLAAADNFHLEYPIEGSAISGLAWGTASAKTVALSFWVYASEAGVYSVSIMEGTNSRSYVTTFTINSATTWEYKTIIIPGDTSGTYQTTNGSFGIKIIWSLGVGSTASTSTSETWQGAAYWNKTGTSQLIQKANGNNLYITGVQLEIGNISTAFQYLNQSEELLLLQRFYFKTMSKGTAVAQNAGAPGVATYIVQGPSNATGGVMINYPVKMSSSPTLTFYNPRTTNAKWRQLSNDIDSGTASSFFANESSVYIANSAGEASTSLVGIHMTANARLGGL